MTARGSASSAETAFLGVTRAFASDPAVTVGTMFGSTTLKVHGKVFAMLVKGSLVLKLPRTDVDMLITERIGTRFDPGHGKPMKEWVSIAPDRRRWLALAKSARDFTAR